MGISNREKYLGKVALAETERRSEYVSVDIHNKVVDGVTYVLGCVNVGYSEAPREYTDVGELKAEVSKRIDTAFEAVKG